MPGPRFGEASLGAVAGTVTGAIGGLVAVGVPIALLEKDPSLVVTLRSFALVGFIIAAPTGWFLGGQIGPRLSRRWRNRHAELIGGVIGGLIPVLAISFWAWRRLSG